MDSYQREAIWRLGKSLRSSGKIIETVSRWPKDINYDLNYAKDQHIQGATANAQRTVKSINALICE